MDRVNWYFRQRVTNPEMKQFTDFVEEADFKNVRELLGNGILTGGAVIENAPTDSQFVQVEQTISRDSLGRRLNVIDLFGDTCSSIVLGLTLQLDGVGVPNTNGTYILFTSKPTAEPFTLVGQKIKLSRSEFAGNEGEFEIKQVVSTNWGGLIPTQIMVRIDEELDEDGYESGLSPRGTTTIGEIVSGQQSKANVAFDELGADIRPVNPGKEKWVSLYARFGRREFDRRLDGNAQQIDYISLENFSYVIVVGTEEDVGTDNRPAITDNGDLFLCDVQHIQGSDIFNAQIDIGRQKKMANLPALAQQVVEYANTLFFGGKIAWSGTNLSIDQELKISVPSKSFQYTVPVFDIALADGELLYIEIDRTALVPVNAIATKVARGSVPEGSVDKLVIVLAERSGNKIQGAYGGELEPGEETDIGDSMGDAVLSYTGMTSEVDSLPDFASTFFLTTKTSLHEGLVEIDSQLSSVSDTANQDKSLQLIKGGTFGPVILGAAQDEIQKTSYSEAPDAGTFVISTGAADTNPLAFNASNAAIQTEIENELSLVGVVVGGDFNSGHTFTFSGVFAGQNQPQLTVKNVTLEKASVAVETTIETVQDGSDGVFNISFSSNAYIQVPGLQDGRNTILSDVISLSHDGSVAYVDINRDAGADANLAIKYGSIEDVKASKNGVIIARRLDGNRAIINDTLLIEGQSHILGSNISEENKQLLGVDNEAQSDNDWSGRAAERFINPADSQAQALANMESELAKLFGQFRITKHETDLDKARISAADQLLADGAILSQTMQSLIVAFDGGVIDFTAQQVFASDGVTPLGIDFPDMDPLPNDEYTWIGVGIIPSILDAQGRITAQVLLTPTNTSNAVESSADEAIIAGTIPRGAILLFNDFNGGTGAGLTVSKIREFGPGSGGGGGGAGDVTDLQTRIANRLNLTDFKYAAVNVFKKSAETLIDDLSTAAYKIVDANYEYENNGDFLETINMFGSQYLSNNSEVNKAEISHYVNNENPGLDSVAEVSRDGGNTYVTATMNRIGVSDAFRALVEFPGTDSGYVQTIGAAPIGNEALTDLNFSKQSNHSCKQTTIKEIAINLVKTGSPAGFIYAEIRKDDGGSPDMTAEGFVVRSRFVDVNSLLTGAYSIEGSMTAPAGDYHILIKSEDIYKNVYSAGVNQIAINNAGTGDIRADLTGYEHDLRVKITRGVDTLTSEGFGILYQFSKGQVFQEGEIRQKTFKFNGVTDNLSTFPVDWNPDRRVMMIFEIGTGQVYRYGLEGFLIEGKDIIFEPNTFNKPEDITLEIVEFMGTSIVNDDFFTGLMNNGFFGSPGDYESFLKAGRGHFFMRPDGTIRELTIDNNDEIAIYSV